jgi:hypothetical protein
MKRIGLWSSFIGRWENSGEGNKTIGQSETGEGRYYFIIILSFGPHFLLSCNL